MARIRNSSLDNVYGEGKEQIFTDDNGKEYIIKNSSLNNVYGTGKEKRVVESNSNNNSLLVELLSNIIPNWLQILLFIGFFAWLIFGYIGPFMIKFFS